MGGKDFQGGRATLMNRVIVIERYFQGGVENKSDGLTDVLRFGMVVGRVFVA